MTITSMLKDAHELGWSKAFAEAPKFFMAKVTLGTIWDRSNFLYRSELKNRCASQESIYEYGSSEKVSILVPHSATSFPNSFVDKAGIYHSEQPFIGEIGSARLVGDQPLGVTPSGELVVETAEADVSNLKSRVFDHLRDTNPFSAYSDFSSFEPRSNPDFGRVFPIVRHSDGASYFHWMLGFAHKVRGLEQYKKQSGNDPTVLVQANAPSWVEESLELLGLDIDSCVRWEGGTAQVESLIVPSHNIRSASNYNPSPSECQWIKERMWNTLEIENPNPEERIYISREDASDRHVLNRSEVLDVVQEFGFNSYKLSELDVAEQIRLFANAEAVIGPHGAGFTNIIFADAAQVIEFLPECRTKSFFFCLSQEIGLEHDFLICPCDNSANITVNVSQLRTTLEDKI